MDKFREDFKKDFEFLDWLKELSPKERKKYLSKSDLLEEGAADPTIINLGNETIEEFAKRYNLHDASEWIERLSNL